LTKGVKESSKRECAIHATLKHKNIIEMYEYAENDIEIAIYMEHANKPFYLNELILEKHTPIEDEQTMKKFSHDILLGLEYIHRQGIIHGDLKLPNMLCNEQDGETTVKICDFGLSHIAEDGVVFITDVSGTFGHIAPEVKSNTYITSAIDMWCFGLILYEMAVAYKPTQIKNYSYKSGDIPFRKYDWRSKSADLKDLISKCMSYDPTERITAEEALKHPWFMSEH
jgi:serine/threonine protein kinase